MDSLWTRDIQDCAFPNLTRLMEQLYSNVGYRCRSLMRVSLVVRPDLDLGPQHGRAGDVEAAAVLGRVVPLQPGAIRRASAGAKASQSTREGCVLRLPQTRTTLSACGKCMSTRSRRTAAKSSLVYRTVTLTVHLPCLGAASMNRLHMLSSKHRIFSFYLKHQRCHHIMLKLILIQVKQFFSNRVVTWIVLRLLGLIPLGLLFGYIPVALVRYDVGHVPNALIRHGINGCYDTDGHSVDKRICDSFEKHLYVHLSTVYSHLS